MTIVHEPPATKLTQPERRPRPDPVVHLHIGAMKTGTTFLQGVLAHNKEHLADAGLLYPGATWRHQVRAVQDVMDATHGDPNIEAQAQGAWRDLTREMMGHPGPSLVSMEFLSHADTEQAHRVMSSLGSTEVHVVLTVRDAAATIPAQWQTTVRNGSTLRWEEFRRGVRRAGGRRGRPGRWSNPAAVKFRTAQDVARMLEVWRRFLPAERIHVVTVPRAASDPALLWQRFSTAVGIGAEVEIDAAHAGGNQSLGYASTELLRRVNTVLNAGSDAPLLSDYNATVREELAGRILSGRSAHEVRPLLDHKTAAFALSWNESTRQALASTGVAVVGEVRDLPVDGDDAAVAASKVDDRQPAPSAEQLLEVAEESLPAMRRMVARREARASRRGLDVRRERREPTTRRGATRDDAVATAVDEIAELCREGIALRQALKGR